MTEIKDNSKDKMIGWINDITYRINENNTKTDIVLAIKLENGSKKVIKVPFKPYFYIKEKDESAAKKIIEKQFQQFVFKKTDFLTPEKERALKIIVNTPKQVKPIRTLLENNGIVTYEADIRFIYRFLIDFDYRLIVKYDENKQDIKPIHIVTRDELKVDLPIIVTSLDIETVKDEIKMISFETREFYFSAKEKSSKLIRRDIIVVGKKFNMKNVKVISVNSEKELIRETVNLLNEIMPDVLTGWNVIDFDLQELRKKAKKYGIDFEIGMEIDGKKEKLKLTIESNFFRTSEAEAFGIWIVDALNLVKSSFIKLDDYTLDTAARTILQDKKVELKGPKKEMIEKYYENDIEYLAEYNMKDASLVLDIIEKEKLIELYFERAIATGLPLQKVGSAIVTLDSLYLREAKKRKLVVNNVRYDTNEGISGGYVRTPIPGLHKFVNVLDFKSLYPSIIRTFNIDPYTFVNSLKEEKDVIVAPNGAKFSREEGILPKLINELFEKREWAKKHKNKLMSQAIKITMNSFFGVLANPNCRFYNPKVADAITSFGRLIVKTAANYIIEKGFEVIYGDTDSIFVKSNAKTYEEAVKIGKQHEKEINEFFKDWCKEKYKVESKLYIEYEKTYIKLLMPKGRSGEGVKKRYAGLMLVDGKEELDFTGLETVRSDWTDLAKEFQYNLLWKLFHDEDVEDYIRKVVNELKAGKLDHLLIYRKKLRKHPSEYTKTTPPHVKAARLLDKITSPVIKYVITINGPEPIEKLRSMIDYQHYINKQLKPIANQILEFYGKSFEEIIKGKQKTLFDF